MNSRKPTLPTPVYNFLHLKIASRNGISLHAEFKNKKLINVLAITTKQTMAQFPSDQDKESQSEKTHTAAAQCGRCDVSCQ